MTRIRSHSGVGLPAIRRAAISVPFLFLLPVALAQVSAPQVPTPEPPAAESDTPAPPVPRPEVEDDVFVPSEELAADEEVTFPVDI